MAQGLTNKEVAMRLGVHPSVISNVRNGKAWRHAADAVKIPHVRRVAACGTGAGYRRHRRDGEAACPACLAAVARRSRLVRAAAKAAR